MACEATAEIYKHILCQQNREFIAFADQYNSYLPTGIRQFNTDDLKGHSLQIAK